MVDEVDAVEEDVKVEVYENEKAEAVFKFDKFDEFDHMLMRSIRLTRTTKSAGSEEITMTTRFAR